MSDKLILILVPVVLIGGLVGVAYLLDKRGKKSGPIGPTLPPPGPIGKILLWIARVLVVLMVLSIVGAFAFRSLSLAWITGSFLLMYIIDGTIYRFVRLTGK